MASKTKLLNSDYSKCEIIELCYIQNKCLENEQFEILAKIHEEAKKRILTDYEIKLLEEHLNSKDSDYKYMNELNGLIDVLRVIPTGGMGFN